MGEIITTFSGNETVIGVQLISNTVGISSNLVVYTCPAGKYAKIFVQYLSASANSATVTIGSRSQYSLVAAQNLTDPSLNKIYDQNFIIGPGQTIEIQPSTPINVTYDLIIREFAIP